MDNVAVNAETKVSGCRVAARATGLVQRRRRRWSKGGAKGEERIARDFMRRHRLLGFYFQASSHCRRLTVFPLFIWFFLVKENFEGDRTCRARCSVPRDFFRICSLYCATICRWIHHRRGGIIRVHPQTCSPSYFYTV